MHAPPQPFSCLTSVKLFSHLHYSCILLQNTSEKHATKSLPVTYQPFAHFATVLQRRVKSGYKLTFFVARPSDLISWSEILSGQWTPWLPFRSVRQKTAFSNFSLWLVITIVHFVFREEIQVNQNTNTPPDFVAWNSWKLTSWACYHGCCSKGKKSWRCCLVRKYVRWLGARYWCTRA